MKSSVKKLLTAACVLCLMVTVLSAGAMAAEPETAVFNGEEYVKLYTVVCDSSLTMIDEQFDQYYEGGSAADGVAAIAKAGNVFVNGQQVPHMAEDGTVTPEKLVVNGEDAIWPVE